MFSKIQYLSSRYTGDLKSICLIVFQKYCTPQFRRYVEKNAFRYIILNKHYFLIFYCTCVTNMSSRCSCSQVNKLQIDKLCKLRFSENIAECSLLSLASKSKRLLNLADLDCRSKSFSSTQSLRLFLFLFPYLM